MHKKVKDPSGKKAKFVNVRTFLGLWRGRFVRFWTLSKILVMVSVLAVCASGVVSGYAALKILYENKLRDTWAILFLNLEHMGMTIQIKLRDCCEPHMKSTHSGSFVGRYQMSAKRHGSLSRVEGSLPEKISWYELGLVDPPLANSWTAARYGDQALMLFIRDQSVYFWTHDPGQWLAGKKVGSLQTKIYVVTRSGSLVYSNSPDINQTNFKQRNLIASFIKKRTTNGQSEIQDNDRIYGFFYEIPKTNLIIFAETSKDRALTVVWDLARTFGLILTGILMLSAILVGFPISRLLRPIKELSLIAQQVGKGDFTTLPQSKGYGELGPLVASFGTMNANLLKRDRQIHQLMEDRLHNLRMAHELAIAKNLQDTFIKPPRPIPAHFGAQLAVSYKAAEECAGDWYACHVDEKTQDITLAIADVSGHGVGSSMFTAIIAALYDERTETFVQNPRELMEAVHYRIRHLAGNHMHATFQVVTWHRADETLHITNAGHPFPVLEQKTDGLFKAKMVAVPSAPLGIDAMPRISSLVVPVPEDFRLMLYTDGLTEGRQAGKGGVFGNKRLLKSFSESSNKSCQETLDHIVGDWKAHLKGRPPSDDMCILLLERRSPNKASKAA